MTNDGLGLSGHNFDAFVSSQRTFSDYDFAAKIQEKYWRARQKFLAKIEKKEDSCVILSDSKLDAKLEIYRSIDKSCEQLTYIMENYLNCLYMYANEENCLGSLLKEFGKHDKTKAGKIMSIVGKSLTQSSHQTIKLYMPLMRLYQEMETFHSRAVDDTSETVSKLESKRSQYRASLLWMKDTSEKLDPDVYTKLDKFRRIQSQVRQDKKSFDNIQMDVVQKIDLLMASRCNLMNQILAPYQATMLETFEKNTNNFRSVQDIVKNEDIYEYEFKILKQLNPLKISDSQPENLSSATSEPSKTAESSAEVLVDLLGEFVDENDNETSRANLIEIENDTKNLISEGWSSEENRKSKIEKKKVTLTKPKIGPALLDFLPEFELKEDEDGPQGEGLDSFFNSTSKQDAPGTSPKSTEEAPDFTQEVDDLVASEAIEATSGISSSKNIITENSSDNPSSLVDLITNELDDIDNSSYFKSLQGLQL